MDYIDSLDTAKEICYELVGMTKEDAMDYIAKNGYGEVRVTSENNYYYALTKDLHPLRFNLHLNQDRVIKAELG